MKNSESEREMKNQSHRTKNKHKIVLPCKPCFIGIFPAGHDSDVVEGNSCGTSSQCFLFSVLPADFPVTAWMCTEVHFFTVVSVSDGLCASSCSVFIWQS